MERSTRRTLLFGTASIAWAAACGLDVDGSATPGGTSPDAPYVPTDARSKDEDPTSTTTPIGGGNDADGATDAPAAADAPHDAGVCPSNTVCEVIASTTVLDVAVTATALFWLDSAGAVKTAAKDGSGAKAIVTGEGGALAGIEADAQFVYWTANGKLRRAGATNGASPADVTSVTGGCLKWFAAGSMLASDPGAGNVDAIDVSTGNHTNKIVGATSPWGVAVAPNGSVFYTNYVTSSGLIRQLVPGQTSAVLVQDQAGPRCIATDGTSIWWANRTSGDLVRSTTTGGSVQTIAPGQVQINGVALDAAWVYWSWQGGIRKRSK